MCGGGGEGRGIHNGTKLLRVGSLFCMIGTLLFGFHRNYRMSLISRKDTMPNKCYITLLERLGNAHLWYCNKH